MLSLLFFKMRNKFINHITRNKEYLNLCRKVSGEHYQDLFQEIAILLLTMPQDKLPQESYFNFWFYRVATNLCSKHGTYGYQFRFETVSLEDLSKEIVEQIEYVEKVDEYIPAEDLLMDLPEFENRVILLYNELGNMRKVQRMTGISYSALRMVKEKLKNIR
jgi:DNA-directed RNA polymerase specialized sigma24 family protein